MRETEPLISESTFFEDRSGVVSTDEGKQSEHFFSDAPNFFWIETSLLINVFLSGFDGTVTASTYSMIGNEFKALSIAPWITSSYLISSTAFQPLYGSLSDIFGRRICICFALFVFGIGCYGCFLSTSMEYLIAMRALTGIGGGGLMCLSTITNSDIIYSSKRGLFQAIQNLLLGTGSVCGASFGGVLASWLGWRWCFAIQVFPSVFSFIVAMSFISNETEMSLVGDYSGRYTRIDIKGSATLVISLTSQLLVLSLGGNELLWTDWRIGLLIVVSIWTTKVFFQHESTTTAIPIIPVNDYKSRFVAINILLNFCVGLSSYAYLFILPLLFQINLGDSLSEAGFRLSIPALATPIGGLTAGILMSKSKEFARIALFGTILMALGNILAMFISYRTANWLIDLYLSPTNFGQGLANPSLLFLFIYYFDSAKQAASTSTVYLMRNIGGVWGVTYISIITQSTLKRNLRAHLSNLQQLSKEQIEQILQTILKSIDILDSMDPEVKAVVVKDYTFAIRLAQSVSSACCIIALVCAYISRNTQSHSFLE